MTRLKDIALQAGVSVMTVSKALRDAADISAETKARIQHLARILGYVPNSAAQGLRSRTSRLLGILVPALTNPIFARILLAIEERASELGYDLLISQSLNNPEREELCLRRLLARRVDGLFISPVYRLSPKAPIYDEIKAHGPPTVILGHLAPFCPHFPNIETDDVHASYRLTKHLLELRHTRIAFLTGPPGAPWAVERQEGYRRGLREAGLEIKDEYIFSAGATIEDGGKAALQLLNEGQKVTAVVAVNDLVAVGAASIFLGQGIRIPEELSITGFGNVLMSEHFRVPLTTVRQPKFRLGVAAIDLMVKMLRGEKPQNQRLPCELMIRDSTAVLRPEKAMAENGP